VITHNLAQPDSRSCRYPAQNIREQSRSAGQPVPRRAQDRPGPVQAQEAALLGAAEDGKRMTFAFAPELDPVVGLLRPVNHAGAGQQVTLEA